MKNFMMFNDLNYWTSLNISPNVKCLEIVDHCIPFCHYSMTMSMMISFWRHVFFNVTFQNLKILDSTSNWPQLAFLEAYYIKNHDLIINYSLKASKELLLFQYSVFSLLQHVDLATASLRTGFQVYLS